ncbi:MAG: CmcI family methyltransferase [Acidimicrobiia bacterium]
MFPLWEPVIAPFIDTVAPRRVVEIGALRGETTKRMLERLGADCELHVIDPLPQFDPAEHERAFPGRYIFHLGISHDVLPTLPPADVALVDGDHNWFTVHRELHMLAATAREAGVGLPLLILHDVAWPYGRRDLYYSPERIPAEHRQPHRQAGMRPGRSELLPNGGMNLELDNAEHEGGPRNGVMTALDDFMAEHDRPLRCLVLPVYYGLAVVAEEERLAANPALAALFDHWEGPEGQRAATSLAEGIRLDEAIFTQAWVRALRQQIERGAERYLAVTKAALLDEHYLDNEVRLEHLGRLLGQERPDLAPLRDPARLLRAQHQRISRARAAGRSLDGDGNLAFYPYTDMGRAQLDHLQAALDLVRAGPVPGDVAEVGVGRGGGAMFLRAYLEAHEVPDRRVWVADRFLATVDDAAEAPANDTALAAAVRRSGADLHQVRDGFARFGLLDDSVRFLQGAPATTVPAAGIEQLALVRFGPGLGDELAPAIEAVHPHLAPGAVVVVAGTSSPAVEAAVVEARRRVGIDAPLERVDWNALTWTMPPEPVVGEGGGAEEPVRRAADAASLAPPSGAEPVDLSVVVVFFNMRREARRTLQSLSRSYQRQVEDLAYEVIVVDNGSAPDQRLTLDEVRAYGPEFHLLDMGAAADPSPTVALNAGVAAARGEHLALMIDGAHVLTPGVLHHGMLALRAYAPAVVATQQWYVGPGQQDEALHEGYDQTVEDRLFDRIQWPVDGYRLFEIGHFIGERDWFDGIVESNCVFMPRKLLEQVGGVDERFSMPGGGYANLDLFERLALGPDVAATSILGEGSFHQFHGGTTTNVPDGAERRERVASYGEHFAELRGRPLLGLDRPVRFVGALDPSAAKRTRPRRAFAALSPLRDPVAHGTSTPPVPVADELKLAAIEAIWDRQAWADATWLGHRVNRFPTDLHVYQELLTAQRPDVVVLAADDDGLGGRGLYLASVLDQLGSGAVVTVGPAGDRPRPEHPRLVHVEGDPDDPEVAARVAALAAGGRATVFLALGQDRRVVAAFERYAPLVPVGGYVVVENTVVNGRPAAAGFGSGPMEAVFQLLPRHCDFVVDHEMERYTVTFNRGGYLRRLEPR